VKPYLYLLIAIVGLLFGLGACVTARRSPVWARASFLLFGALASSCGTLGYFLEHYRSALQYSTRQYLDHYRTLLGGIAIGVFVVLAISGQMKPDTKLHDKV